MGRKPLGALFSVLVVAVLVAPTGSAASAPRVSPTGGSGVRATSSVLPAKCLHQATRKFFPTKAKVKGVTKARVLWVGRYSNGIPKAPPLTTTGKRSFGWDRKGRKPGGHKGNVRFNAHTYPDGSALGNTLLSQLWVGAPIIVKDRSGHVLCYRVTKRIQVTPRSHAARVGYYATRGKPKLAIVVCSGTRLGPGNWTMRTIWYAKPSTS